MRQSDSEWSQGNVRQDGAVSMEGAHAMTDPKTPAQRKAFKRWTRVENCGYFDGGHRFCGTRFDIEKMIAALNAARVTLPTGRKAKP